MVIDCKGKSLEPENLQLSFTIAGTFQGGSSPNDLLALLAFYW